MLESLSKINCLAQRLVNDQYLDAATALSLSQQAQTQHLSLVNLLVSKRIVAASILAKITAHDFGLPLFDLHCFDVSLLPSQHLNEKLIIKHRAVPLYQGTRHLNIAMSDPSSSNALHEFKFSTGLNCLGIVVEDDKLTILIEDILSRQTARRLTKMEDTTHPMVIQPQSFDSTTGDGHDDAPVVHFVNQLIQDAIKRGVSDIHFEPYETSYRIRFRRDGMLYQAATPPRHLAARICARIKVMSRLDIAERRLPQDGHFHMTLADASSIHCRVNTCPTTTGEKVVMRLLDPNQCMTNIDALGYEHFQHSLLMQCLKRSQGMLLVTGPTGSGKTVSLYAALNWLNNLERNIMTIEDPVEIQIPGINQVNIHVKTGLTFSNVLRALLRQDPDVIMVGEIRDLETADIAMQAAQTGHLVLSTLHTNNATQALARLMHMGVAAFHIMSSVQLIIAQRLARRLCHHCRQTEHVPASRLTDIGFTDIEASQATLYQARVAGCEHCHHGFHGRIGLYEMLWVSAHIGEAVMNGDSIHVIEKIALQEGMQTLRRAGIHKVLAGVTSIEEVLRVTTA